MRAPHPPVDHSPAVLSAADRQNLLLKYQEIHSIRQVADPKTTRPRMRRLAARFPGALRELDQLPPSEVARRVAQLNAGESPLWAACASEYHRWLRVLLCVRYRCRTEDGDPIAICEEVLAKEALFQHNLTPSRVVEIAHTPPGGRLNPWVFSRLAARFALTSNEIERAIFFAAPG